MVAVGNFNKRTMRKGIKGLMSCATVKATAATVINEFSVRVAVWGMVFNKDATVINERRHPKLETLQ